jgi:hypothetical protein
MHPPQNKRKNIMKIRYISVVILTMLVCQNGVADEQEGSVIETKLPLLLARSLAVVERCEKACYRTRSACYSEGKETEVCESQYDNCAAQCN